MYKESMDCIRRVWNVYREGMDWVKGESGLYIGRVWTV